MKAHIINFRIWILLALAVAVMSGCAVNPYNPNAKADLQKVRSIAVVPAEVFVGLNKFAADNERLTDKEAENRPKIDLHCNDAVLEKGFELVSFDFNQAVQDDEEFAFLISKFKEDVATANKNPKVWSPVGDSARELAAAAGADALLFVDYKGIRKSGGEVAKDVGVSVLAAILTAGAYIPVSAQNGAIANAYLVDGVSGEVLWRKGQQGGEDPALVAAVLKQFPAGQIAVTAGGVVKESEILE